MWQVFVGRRLPEPLDHLEARPSGRERCSCRAPFLAFVSLGFFKCRSFY